MTTAAYNEIDITRIIALLEERAPLAEERSRLDTQVKSIDKEVVPALKEVGEVFVPTLNKTFYASKPPESRRWKIATLFRIFMDEGLTPLQVSTILGDEVCKINEEVLSQTAILTENPKLTKRCAGALTVSIGSSHLVGRKGE